MSGNLPTANTLIDNETTSFFNNLAIPNNRTSSEVDDAVVSYFETVTGSKEAGRTMASAVLFTALSQGIDLPELLDQFRKLKPGELDSYLTLFLNLDRVGTSLLGVSNAPQQSKYITRTILA